MLVFSAGSKYDTRMAEHLASSHKMSKCTLFVHLTLTPDWYSGSTQAVRVCSNRQRKSGTAQHHRGGAKRSETWRGWVK